jgi:tetratricopeptide (TPR) repeat protein
MRFEYPTYRAAKLFLGVLLLMILPRLAEAKAAQDSLRAVLVEAEASGNEALAGTILLELGKIALAGSDEAQAAGLIDRALPFLQKENKSELLREAYFLAATAHARTGQLRKALGMQENFIRLNESIHEKVYRETRSTEAQKQDLPAKEAKASELTEDVHRLVTSKKAKEKAHWVYLAGLCLLVLIDGSLVFSVARMSSQTEP